MGVALICNKGPSDPCQHSRELCLSVLWLSLGVALDLGRVVSFASSLGIPLVLMGLFNTKKHIYCLSGL